MQEASGDCSAGICRIAPITVPDAQRYPLLYRHSWGDPEIRWLMSTVPTAMIFDDHDLRDGGANNHQYYDEVHLNNKGGTLPHVVARARDSCCCRI